MNELTRQAANNIAEFQWAQFNILSSKIIEIKVPYIFLIWGHSTFYNPPLPF